jgi:methylglyoxal synthase
MSAKKRIVLSDVRALLRIAVVWNIPVACNRASADFMITSPLLSGTYERFSPDYHEYTTRMDEDHAEQPGGT